MASGRYTGFKPETLAFLRELKKNNNRDWFKENKSRYEEQVLDVALHFIQSMHDPLKEITPHFTAIPKRMGGSLMRVYRDTRFCHTKQILAFSSVTNRRKMCIHPVITYI
jgi:uncharacterized protein (TIGR02453 family)